MSGRDSMVLIVGATGSVGRHAIAEALRQNYLVRALVRDSSRARSLPDRVELVVGDLTHPATLKAAVAGVDAIVRPGWFDYNDQDQRRILMRQGRPGEQGGAHRVGGLTGDAELTARLECQKV